MRQRDRQFQGARSGAVVSYAISPTASSCDSWGGRLRGHGTRVCERAPDGKICFVATTARQRRSFSGRSDGTLGEATTCGEREPRHHPQCHRHPVFQRSRGPHVATWSLPTDRPVRHRERSRPRPDSSATNMPAFLIVQEKREARCAEGVGVGSVLALRSDAGRQHLAVQFQLQLGDERGIGVEVLERTADRVTIVKTVFEEEAFGTIRDRRAGRRCSRLARQSVSRGHADGAVARVEDDFGGAVGHERSRRAAP